MNLEDEASAPVVEVLEAFHALCLKCLVTQTGSRLKDVILELEALRADVSSLRCTVCDDDWPVFAMTPTRVVLKRVELS